MKNELLTGLRVLVAEDNPLNQKVIAAILRQNGALFEFAQNGEEAIHKFGPNYDIVLMDCQMPQFDGYQATVGIRVMEQTTQQKKRCPIVALTASAMRGDREKCLSVGMDDFLAKPFKSQELVEKIRQWTGAQ